MMNISLEEGTTLIEYKETSQLLLVHVLLPLLFAGYIEMATCRGISTDRSLSSQCSNKDSFS